MKPYQRNSWGTTLGLALTLVLLAVTPASAAEEWILFSTNRSGTFDIWKIQRDGTALAPVIESSQNLRFPRVSPDGTKISYAVIDSANGNSVQIYDFATGAIEVFSVFYANRHDWAPDMSGIWGNGFTRLSCEEDIDYLDLSSGSVSGVLVEPRRQSLLGVDVVSGEVFYHSDPCWSPYNVLKAYDPASGAIRVVKGNDGVSGEDHGDISPDGQHLAFAKSLVGYQDPHRIFWYPTSGGGPEIRLSSDTGLGDIDPDVSIDGSEVVFQRRVAGGAIELWIVATDGSYETPLLQDQYINVEPNWELVESQDLCPGGNDSLDADGDGVPDFCDPCPQDAENDADGDGVCGDVDLCPGADDNLNQDGDGLPDACDVCPADPGNDADGDGLCESDDNCPLVFNPNQVDSDGDGLGDACDEDDDGDGVLDSDDNCPLHGNPEQLDSDSDGAGDVCDGDDDGDDVIDDEDECPGSEPGSVVSANGCSIAQLCPCAHPVGANQWKNHGAYVRCVTHTAEVFVEFGLITEEEKESIVSNAAQSTCGKKN